MSVLPDKMRAMVFRKAKEALRLEEVPLPRPGPGQILIKVHACGVCRTDLHIFDGELNEPKLPLILGHEIVGEVAEIGEGVTNFSVGDRVGVPWLASTDGHCKYCRREQENLCENAQFTGYTVDGGFAEYTVADARFSFHLNSEQSDTAMAPWMCAGLIGYRSYRMTGEHVTHLGLYGFGAAAHILTQVAVFQQKKVYAFTRDGDVKGQEFAKSLGATWAGGSDDLPPETLDAAIIFAPVGALVPAALRALDKGGTVVCGGIYMSDIPALPYHLLWEERVVRSVANLTRRDGEEFLEIAAKVPVKTQVQVYPLEQANEAIAAVRGGKIKGATVLSMVPNRTTT